ncbi:Uncharacterised protein [Mycobacteroides abscessus subsp. abscessus]|nr:Uncharacterised protein [Mycobacteroides abscessus subsp. abscessus]
MKIVGSVTTFPPGTVVKGPPSEARSTWPRGSTPASRKRQPKIRPAACSIAGDGSSRVKSPISAMPQLCSLNPPVCAPCTLLVMPPKRPSKICPYLSTRTL